MQLGDSKHNYRTHVQFIFKRKQKQSTIIERKNNKRDMGNNLYIQ